MSSLQFPENNETILFRKKVMNGAFFLMDLFKGRVILFAPILVISIVLIGWWLGEAGSFVENPLRIVLSGIYVLVLPGLLSMQALKLRIDSLLEAIAVSFFASLIVALVCIILILTFHGGINAWAWLLSFWNVGWLVYIIRYRRIGCGGPLDTFVTISAPQGAFSERMFVFALLLLSVALYRWADRLTTVYWELGVHFSYIRYYGSGLGLTVYSLGLRPELPMPNLFFLWEFVLAGVSNFSGQDPLISVMRTRWIVPILGFSGFYVFLRHVLNDKKLASMVLWGALILSLTQVMFLSPNPFVTSKIVSEVTRPIFSFLSSMHHSDIAMEVLLPMIVGFLFAYIQRGNNIFLGIVAVSLFVAFFFHPREFFQLMWYGGLWSATVLFTVRGFERRTYLRRSAALTGIFILVAGVCALITTYGGGAELAGQAMLEGQAELDKKISSIKDFVEFGWLPPYFENPINFQMHMEGRGDAVNPPMVFSFLVLATLMLPVLAAFGSPHERRLAMFFVALWIFSTTFIPAERVLTILTYSEMLITKVRVLPMFAIIIIVLGWARLVGALNHYTKSSGWRVYAQSMILGVGAGAAFVSFWRWDIPDFNVTRIVFPGVLIFAIALLIVSIWEQRVKQALVSLRGFPFPPHGLKTENGTMRHDLAVLLSIGVFASITGHEEGARLGQALLFANTNTTALSRDNNDLNLPVEVLDFIREDVPLRARIYVRPLSIYMLSAFAPIQIIPIPRGQIHADEDEITQEYNGVHPVFNRKTQQGRGDVGVIISHLREKRAEFMLIGKEYYAGFKTMVTKYPNIFEVVHEVPEQTIFIRLTFPQVL